MGIEADAFYPRFFCGRDGESAFCGRDGESATAGFFDADGQEEGGDSGEGRKIVGREPEERL